jgi:hypothetical protein
MCKPYFYGLLQRYLEESKIHSVTDLLNALQSIFVHNYKSVAESEATFLL